MAIQFEVKVLMKMQCILLVITVVSYTNILNAAAANAGTPAQQSHNSESIKQWINEPYVPKGQTVPPGYVDPNSAAYGSFKTNNNLAQLARKLHDKKITLTQAFQGLDQNSQGLVAHFYFVRYKTPLLTDPNVLK